VDILAVPPEQRMRRDGDLDQRVAGWAAGGPGIALAA